MNHTLHITTVDRAIKKGIRFLMGKTDKNSLWSDFHTPAGFSTEWVSGFVLTSIAGLTGYQSLAQRAINNLIRKRRPSGGWGYNEGIPEDCDSTAWVLLALIANQFVQPLVIRRGLDFIASHQSQCTGGFSTFRPVNDVQDLITQSGSASGSRGWLSPQTCVTAVSTIALLSHEGKPSDSVVAAAVRYLESQRDPSGLWSSYWWRDVEYGTFHATLALSWVGKLTDNDRAEIANKLLEMANTDGSWGDNQYIVGNSFATSFALLSIMLAPPSNKSDFALLKGMTWLLKHQLEDGSWQSVPILRIPESQLGDCVIIPDNKRIFTTAATLRALGQYRISGLASKEYDGR